MARLHFEGIGVRALAAAVPKNKVINLEYTTYFPPEEVKEVVEKIGIYERRFAPEGMTSSDLCFAAASQLITDLKISPDEIDLLVFVSQTPDYRMPASSVILQNRLGLPKTTMTFDVNMGCAGFLHGLSIVYSFMLQPGFRKALLLDGETRSKVYSPKDRRTAFLFGDAGVAALIEKDAAFGSSYFSIKSDGSRENLIKIKAGGYRFPSSAETVKEKVVDEYGNIRSDEHAHMDGGEVFNFLISEVPPDIMELMRWSGKDLSSFDFYVFHQANNFMNTYIRKKLKLPAERVPMIIDRFGNTSSVSIPLTIAVELKNQLNNKDLLLSGFGVGMTWASAAIHVADMYIPDLIELE
ncbi:MAG: 3-oxoacyl-ACP synthase III family protein [Bacteroidales bacterium]